jgi:hypothetical protein
MAGMSWTTFVQQHNSYYAGVVGIRAGAIRPLTPRRAMRLLALPQVKGDWAMTADLEMLLAKAAKSERPRGRTSARVGVYLFADQSDFAAMMTVCRGKPFKFRQMPKALASFQSILP